MSVHTKPEGMLEKNRALHGMCLWIKQTNKFIKIFFSVENKPLKNFISLSFYRGALYLLLLLKDG